ncbi:MAG TPA: hypothetical protein VFM18_14395 [Methanosarcina sp.]|nr:hypothetical protein [Methanosarcina sp.]
MQTVAMPPTTNSDIRPHRSRKHLVAYVFVGLCLISLVGLIVVAMLPRYLVLSIPPPEDSYNQVGWSSTTRSTITTGSSTDFIWREDGTLAYENSDTIPSQKELVKYFHDRFVQMGWEQSDSATPCNIYLPEGAFLRYGENGFLSYLRKGNTDEFPTDDAICLAIWNDKGSPNVYRIVLLTVKRSFFTGLYKIFD